MGKEMGIRWWLFKHDLSNTGADIQRWIVWHAPKCLVMWAFYRVLAHASSGEWGNERVDTLTAFEAIDRWIKKG